MRSAMALIAMVLFSFNSLSLSLSGQVRTARKQPIKYEQSVLIAPAAPVSITTLGTPLTENFNTLSNTAGSTTNSISLPGWEVNEQGGGGRDNEQYAVDTGGSNVGDTYSYGSAGSTERALGGILSGMLQPTFGASFTNNTGRPINSLSIAYTGEQWRVGATTAARLDRLDFEYSLDATSLTTGTWVAVDALDFSSPFTTVTPTGGALDGNAAANRTAINSTIAGLSIPNGSTFYIRWTDFNANSSDDGLAVDDFSISAQSNTAANASISGRVLSANGRAISGAFITVTGLDGVSTKYTTNTFGYYRVDGLLAGESYLVSVSARRYTFAAPAFFVNLNDDLYGVNFTASQ